MSSGDPVASRSRALQRLDRISGQSARDSMRIKLRWTTPSSLNAHGRRAVSQQHRHPGPRHTAAASHALPGWPALAAAQHTQPTTHAPRRGPTHSSTHSPGRASRPIARATPRHGGGSSGGSAPAACAAARAAAEREADAAAASAPYWPASWPRRDQPTAACSLSAPASGREQPQYTGGVRGLVHRAHLHAGDTRDTRETSAAERS